MDKGEIQKSDNSYFANNKSPLKKVGEFLREARQGRNLSVEDLSSSIRIGKEQLIALEEGDEIVFTKLDRGFKNQRQCINTLHDLQGKGIHVRTTDGMINTRALGKFAPIVIGLLSGLGEVERQMVIERTQESINHRRETGGNLGGRPKTNNEKEGLVLRLRNEGCSYRSIRKQTGLALSTIRRIIVEQDVVLEV